MITKEQLIEFGMKETEGDEKAIVPMKKVISLPKEPEDEDDELGEIAICIDMQYNAPRLVLSLPDGSTLGICAETIDELKAFEKCIGSFEPYY
jgi:hypothetical protein